jgi:hypothetical protein
MSETDIRARLEGLIDRWMKASPDERMVLVHEKIRLEDMLHKVQAEANAL